MGAYGILYSTFRARCQVKNNVNDFSMQIAIFISTRRRRHCAVPQMCRAGATLVHEIFPGHLSCWNVSSEIHSVLDWMGACGVLWLLFRARGQVNNNVNDFSMQIAISISTRRHSAPNVPRRCHVSSRDFYWRCKLYVLSERYFLGFSYNLGACVQTLLTLLC